jgi:hypothetical protein
MSNITRVRRLHRVAVVVVARWLGLALDPSQHHHPPFGRRATSLAPRRPKLLRSVRHHDPVRRRVLVRWQGWIGGLLS